MMNLYNVLLHDAFKGTKTVPLGSTQSPGLADYADGIDTLKFLIEQ